MVGVQHLRGDLRIAEPIRQRHALGRSQHQIKRRHAMVAVRPAEELAGVRMAAVEDAHERLGTSDPIVAKRGSATAKPPAW